MSNSLIFNGRPKSRENAEYLVWNQIPDTADYMSACGQYLAIYKGEDLTQAVYWVFNACTPKSKRTQRSALQIDRGMPSGWIWTKVA